MIHYTGISHFLIWGWVIGLFPSLAVMKNAVVDKYKLLFEYVSMGGMVGFFENSMFKLWENW